MCFRCREAGGTSFSALETGLGGCDAAWDHPWEGRRGNKGATARPRPSLQVPAPGTQVRPRKRREVRLFQSPHCRPVTPLCESTSQSACSLWHNVTAHLQSCYYFQFFFPWGNYQEVIKYLVFREELGNLVVHAYGKTSKEESYQGCGGSGCRGTRRFLCPEEAGHPDSDPTGPARGRAFFSWSTWSIQRGLRLYMLVSSLNSHQLVFPGSLN